MILGFKTKFPWGEETKFLQKIIAGVPIDPNDRQGSPGNMFNHLFPPKIHTIRESHRIKPGTLLHMATGVRTKKYFQFNKQIPSLQTCVSTQRIDIIRKEQSVVVYIDKKLMYAKTYSPKKEWVKEIRDQAKKNGVHAEGYSGSGQVPVACYNPEWLEKFCTNDGLTVEQFLRYFKTTCRKWNLVHWTDLKYL